MSATTSGEYRALSSPRDPEELLLLDVSGTDPTYVPTEGYDDPLAERVSSLEPGNRIEATIEWDADGTPRLGAFEVLANTHIEFIDDVTGIFEAARETADEAAAGDDAMNSRVTKSTDGENNGVLYTFAKQSGQRDLYEEFREGITPLEPFGIRTGNRQRTSDPIRLRAEVEPESARTDTGLGFRRSVSRSSPDSIFGSPRRTRRTRRSRDGRDSTSRASGTR